jgi:site-specific DNA recombinase
MKKACMYVRVSTDEQVTEGYSIQAQQKEIIAYAENKQYNITKIYSEEGFSGKNITGRKELQLLLEDAQKHKFETVIIHRIDRLSRNLYDALHIAEKLAELNIELISVSEDVDLTSSMGKMLFQLMSSFAEFERKTISERVKLGMAERAKQGRYSGVTPLGYTAINKELYINDEEAETVRLIFDLAETGLGYKAITIQLNKYGYKTKRKYLFSIATVKYIMENPIYIGMTRYNRFVDFEKKKRKGEKGEAILVPGIHPPIVEQSQWDLVHSLKQERAIQYVFEHKTIHLLTGLIKCPVCSFKMVTVKGVDRDYYCCSNYHNKGSMACSPNTVRSSILEKKIIKDIQKYLMKHSLCELQIEPDGTDYLQLLKVDIKRFEEQKNKLFEQLSDEIIDVKRFQNEFSKIENQIIFFTQKIKIETEKDEQIINLLSLFNGDDRFKQKQLIKILIENIQLEKKEPTINFKTIDDILKMKKKIFQVFQEGA